MAKAKSIRTCRALSVASASLLLAGIGIGCSNKAAPAPTTQAIVESSIGTATVRTEWAEAAKTGVVPDGWLKSFNDPKMEAVVIEALRHNLVLRGAKTRVDAAAGAAVQAGAAMKPAIGVGAGGAGISGDTSGGAGLNVAWEVDLWGRLAAIKTAADEQLVSVQNDYEFARQSLAAQTAKAWYLASDAQQQLNLARETVKIYEELVKVVQAKADAGQITPQDLNLANADVASARERERYAVGAHKDAVRSLEVLMGRYPAAELEVAEQFIPVPPEAPSGVPSEILERRPDMIAAEARVRAAFQNVQVAKLAKLPRLTLSAGGGLASLADGFFGVGGNFFAPIDNTGALQAEVTIQTANQEQALAAYGQNALVAFQEVERGLMAEKLLDEREQLLRTAVEQNEEALRQAKIRFDAGKVSMIDVLQMQARTNLSRAALIDMKQMRLGHRIDLHLALGGSFEMPPPEPAEQTP